MTPTERAKRSDALYYETVSVNRRVLCDMVANREADLEDAKAENEELWASNERMGLKYMAAMGELGEENEQLKAENAKLREEFNKMDVWHSKELTAAMAENAKLRELVKKLVILAFARCADCDLFDVSCALVPTQKCLLWNECESIARELGVEVDDG